MTNKEIAKQFSLLSKLMEIHRENGSKSKTYSIAAYKISQLTVNRQTLSEEKISQINGIGEAIVKKTLIFFQGVKCNSLKIVLKKPHTVFLKC